MKSEVRMPKKSICAFVVAYIAIFFSINSGLVFGAVKYSSPAGVAENGLFPVQTQSAVTQLAAAEAPAPSLPMPPAASRPPLTFVPTTTSTTTGAPRAAAPAQPAVQPVPVPAPHVVPSAPYAPPVIPAPAQPKLLQPPAQQPPVKRGEVSFNFDDADVYSVIQTIFGDVLRVNYIVDPNVKGRVTFRSVEPVAKESVLPLMEVILRLNGIGIVEENGLYRIIPIADISKEPAPVGIGRDPGKVAITGKARVQVVSIQYIQSADMVRVLTPFLSKNAFIVDVPKSNYIVIVDTDANIKRLLELVQIFDSEQLKQVTPRVFVYPVQNSKAKDVASLLQQIFQGAKAPAKTTPTTTQRPPVPGQPAPAAPQPQVSSGQTGGEGLVSEITKIIPDEVTNSIIILATPEDYALIYDTIQKIDILPRQVLIEALIVDVTLNDNLSFGLSWSMNSDVRITGIKPFKNGVDLSGSIYNNAGNLLTSPPNKGFTFIGTDPSGNVRAVLSALDDRSKAKVVAAPHILVSDNREARIQVGQQVPLATSTTAQPLATTGTAVNVVSTSTIQYKDIGIILKVKPQVNDSGLIALELSQEISAISATPVTVGGLDEVSIDKTEATSNLVAMDGETIIIGGLIREDSSHASTGLPFLSRIPILGALFGSTEDKVQRKETIILLTPHVMRNQQEAGAVTSDYVNRYKRTTSDKQLDEFIGRGKRSQENGHGIIPGNSEQPR